MEPRSPGADPRRYDDAEIRLLLQRAASADPLLPAVTQPRGLTLAELESVASEAGIDIARLRRAARELDVQQAAVPAGPLARLAGSPLRHRVERTLPFEVDEAALQRLAVKLGTITGDAGEPRLLGRAVAWSASTHGGRRTELSVSAARGTTTVVIEERYGELAGGMFGGVLGGVGGGVGIGGGTAIASALGSVAAAVAIPVAIAGGAYAACRAGYRAYVRRRMKRLHAMCDAIEQELSETE